ncbi:hypothetical protein AFLA_003579 [Aspergillus flavus NRRL3357]|nr:hypothetical protein AFLA_003579 [Aspergillus flavus NRRL3357]
MMHGLADGGSTAKRNIARWKANGRRNGDGKTRTHEICHSSSCIGGTANVSQEHELTEVVGRCHPSCLRYQLSDWEGDADD